MLRKLAAHLAKVALFGVLVAGGAVGIRYYEQKHSESAKIQKLEEQKQKLEEQKRELQTVVEHLSDEKRVAEILVQDQKPVDGIMRTTLLFVEYARDGTTALATKKFTIDGNTAHIDAMVIKFERDFVAQNDPLRGHSIALFHRLFGETQSPESGYSIDEPGKIPDIYRGGPADPEKQRAFEAGLWENFWRLAEDREYRQAKGVRVANGQGVWGPFTTDRLYTLTLDADGGLNLTSEPLKGIYREAMKQNLSKSE